MNKLTKINVINGDIFSDKRGILRHVNKYTFTGVKRFYQIDLPKKNLIRAFHGHLKESKSVFVISGSLLLCVVKLTDKKSPSKKTKVKKIILKSSNPSICEIPKGFANGIMSLENNTRVIFFSDKTLSDSLNDDYRFPADYWGKEVWKNEK